jgi:hypothetical protein
MYDGFESLLCYQIIRGNIKRNLAIMKNILLVYLIVLGYSLSFIIPAWMFILEFELNYWWLLIVVIPVVLSAYITNKKLRLH